MKKIYSLCGFVCILAIVITAAALSGCSTNKNNLVYTAQRWFPSADPFGSTFEIEGELISEGVVAVHFTIARRPESETWTPWVELICSLGYTLEPYEGVTIRYKNDTDLLVKLSQSDFGPNGNATYSHYQYRLPAAKRWKTRTIRFNTFAQPGWTPSESADVPLILQHINAIYLVPDLNYETGESSTLQVRRLELF